MHPVPNAIRIEAPSIIKIMKGIFKIAHFKQFSIFVVSISIILTVTRVIKIKTFIIICLICGTIAICLVALDYFLKKKEKPNENNDYILLNKTNQWSNSQGAELQVEHVKFYSEQFPGESNICGLCFEPIKEGSDIEVLQCLHFFHPECIEKWTKIRRFCPTCKAQID
jgi:hypothetical protein